MSFLKNLFSKTKTTTTDDGMTIITDDESITVMIPSITDDSNTVKRTVLGTVMDNEGDTWEVSAASGMIWLGNHEEELFSSFNLENAASLLNMVADSVELAHA